LTMHEICETYLQPVQNRKTMNMAMLTDPAHSADDTTISTQAVAIEALRPNLSKYHELKIEPKKPPA